MAQYNITMTEISATMLDELADFAQTAWGVTDVVQVEVVPGGMNLPTPSIEMHLPDPMPATSAIEIVLPPEPIDDLPPEESSPRKRR